MRIRQILLFLFLFLALSVTAPQLHAQTSHTHAQTCGTYTPPTGLKVAGIPITSGAIVPPGSNLVLSWDPVRGTNGGIIDGRVWYHLDIDDLSTASNPDFTTETPVYDKTPITSFASPNLNFVAGHRYTWTIYGKGGCGFGPPTSVTFGVGTIIMGRVATKDANGNITQIWANKSTACGKVYSSYDANLKVNVDRLNGSTVTQSNSYPLSYCNTDAYYSTDLISPTSARLSLPYIPPGYECAGWSYAQLNGSTWTTVASGTGCTTSVLDISALSMPKNNSHHIWFYVRKPTATATPMPPTSTPIVMSPTPVPVCSKPMDVMFVIDRSGSMQSQVGTTGKTKLDLAKTAAQIFISAMQNTDAGRAGLVRAGFTTFGRTLSSTQSTTTPTSPGLSSDLSGLKSKIASINKDESGTCIECGLRVGNNSLAVSRADGKAAGKIVVVLTDGRANRTIASNGSEVSNSVGGTAAIAEADKGKSKGYTFFVVGAGSSSSPELTTYTRGIANYYKGQADGSWDPNQWDDLFKLFQNGICNNTYSIKSVLGVSDAVSVPAAEPQSGMGRVIRWLMGQ